MYREYSKDQCPFALGIWKKQKQTQSHKKVILWEWKKETKDVDLGLINESILFLFLLYFILLFNKNPDRNIKYI